jgi:hypothetical protein
MIDRIQIIRHEVAAKCGSYEVRFPDGRPSKSFYWEDIPGRRSGPRRDRPCSDSIIDLDPRPAAIDHLYMLAGRLSDPLRRHYAADTWRGKSHPRARRLLR